MTAFISFAGRIRLLLETIVAAPEFHSKWLNTLSYLENCGARKIASCEHPTLVREEMLKHASEEFRHAHYLKRQIGKVSSSPLPSYSLPCLLGGFASLHYLTKLNVKTTRYLKEAGFTKKEVPEVAYLLVTYAIELRASELYPIYQEILKKHASRVAVTSILLEEKEHLKEMEEGLAFLPCGILHASVVSAIENILCQQWLDKVQDEISINPRKFSL